MNKKTTLINNIISLGATLGLVILSCALAGAQTENVIINGLIALGGAIVFGLINTFLHEWGHLIAGKINKFELISFSVWFFRWEKINGKLKFKFIMLKDQAGSTELVPTTTENLFKRYRKVAISGGVVSSVLTIISIVPLFFVSLLPVELYFFLSMALPVSAFFALGSLLPMTEGGFRNDGATALGLKRKDDIAKVTVGLLEIQALLYQGKTPSEIEEEKYFNLPQLPEDEIMFINLLNARYNYYLDKKDYANAIKTIERLLGLEEYMPKGYINEIKVDALFNACTFNYNEDLADDLTYELEKYLNNVNTAKTLRAKLAYLLYVRKEKEVFDMFYNKGIKEAKNSQLKGLIDFEIKLFESIKENKEKFN
ncbi:MAG: hypothetical protein IKW33_01115 [Clostridia bacterium]|nr:hypothetical protein [Clostridia bacterium]